MKSIAWDGKRITKPGCYSGVPLSLYHSADICDGPSISSSGLRRIFNESPAHFYAEWPGNPDRVERTDTKAFVLGRAAHHLSLGERFFSKLFCIQPDEWPDENGEVKPWHNGRNVCKAWREARRKEGRAILTNGDIDSIRGMATTLAFHPVVRAGALNGQIERSIFWQDKKTGVWLKARPDSIPASDEDYVDLKTTDSVIWPDLVRTIGKFGYHQQGALIRQAAREVLRMKNPTFTLVFVEKAAPFCVRVVTLKDNDLDRGEKQNRAALDLIASCLKSNKWPGPGGDAEDAEYVELSEYEQKRIDEKLTIMGAG